VLCSIAKSSRGCPRAQIRCPIKRRRLESLCSSLSFLASLLHSFFSLSSLSPPRSLSSSSSSSPSPRPLFSSLSLSSHSQILTSLTLSYRHQRNSTSTTMYDDNPYPTDIREYLYKVLVIGDLGTGKTSIIKRYVHNIFSMNYKSTVCVPSSSLKSVRSTRAPSCSYSILRSSPSTPMGRPHKPYVTDMVYYTTRLMCMISPSPLAPPIDWSRLCPQSHSMVTRHRRQDATVGYRRSRKVFRTDQGKRVFSRQLVVFFFLNVGEKGRECVIGRGSVENNKEIKRIQEGDSETCRHCATIMSIVVPGQPTATSTSP